MLTLGHAQGFAHPYLLIALLVIVGGGVAVYSGSRHIAGLVLGTKTRKENIYQNRSTGIKVTIVSPNSSWDMMEYLCKTLEECEKSSTSGKWWTTVSGAPTAADGYEVSVERSADWGAYNYIRFSVKSANGIQLVLQATKGTSAISDLSSFYNSYHICCARSKLVDIFLMQVISKSSLLWEYLSTEQKGLVEDGELLIEQAHKMPTACPTTHIWFFPFLKRTRVF